MPNFESFSRRMLPLKAEPYVTIHKRGTLSLNGSAFAALGSPKAVELLFDQRERIIGLRPAPADGQDVAHVRATSHSSSGPWVVSAMAFIKYYEIDTSVSRRWSAAVEDGVLCVDLNAEGTPVTSNRSADRPSSDRSSSDRSSSDRSSSGRS